ncbi:glycoside hydrolase family 3 C-terminal domain-containing protein [Streptomyces sp. 549]|uniref:glycoside hydrolase family 3 protein n=1 Tax=Streptomyces sp. 549 TaxID=3049076 RepID=UPI0024C3F50F|nr:glycoside hydrolase family 3 C-terminal domain-containing protein [Streptomyces sp. 549]MDK1473953.1 glycoside hydrolase family 3 C-terminal domain-containing protein [Streptomyces sp. 549]
MTRPLHPTPDSGPPSGSSGSGPTSGTEAGKWAAAAASAVEQALRLLDLDTKARLLAGQDTWTLPAVPGAGLASLVMSDGPVGVRGVRWSADDPSVALPSPTALAATWDPELARRAGRLLAQEARRKGVHVLLAPTVNLHRSPLGGRHFESYSEDPLLTGLVGSGYVAGVQDGGVAATVKHFVANDAETDRFTVNNVVGERALRELYLRPFEIITARARPWAVMSAYNSVNGPTMTEHDRLQNGVLRGEWGFDGVIVSDWLAARDTERALTGGLDVAMPGPRTVYGPALAEAVRAGRVEEARVDDAVRRVLLLAARVGALDTVAPAVDPDDLPAPLDGREVAREVATRSFVLVRNSGPGGAPVLPLAPRPAGRIALSGAAARDARVLGGGSATVFPDRIVAPLDGLRDALPQGALSYSLGADPNDRLLVAAQGFELRTTCRDAAGSELGGGPLPTGQVQWLSELPDGVEWDALHSVEITGTFTPRESGAHAFGTRGVGEFRLTVDGRELFAGTQSAPEGDPFDVFFGAPEDRGQVELTAGSPVEVALRHTVRKPADAPVQAVGFALMHLDPRRDPDELIAEAAEEARSAQAAVVVVATTDLVESEGFDRTTLALPGRQDDLVRAVAAANPRTVVVVNSGSPVEMPWREEVAAVLLTWFPGQEAGAALADVLLGAAEPGGRLPTTWPARLTDAPVSRVVPEDGELVYEEGVFIGYRAWQQAGTEPAYPFGHGLGYTEWSYDSLTVRRAADGGLPQGEGEVRLRATVVLRNTGARPGRETVQLYVAPLDPGGAERPERWLAGFATVTANPGETVEAVVEVPHRAFEVWDEELGRWRHLDGGYRIEVGRSLTDPRLSTTVTC